MGKLHFCSARSGRNQYWGGRWKGVHRTKGETVSGDSTERSHHVRSRERYMDPYAQPSFPAHRRGRSGGYWSQPLRSRWQGPRNGTYRKISGSQHQNQNLDGTSRAHSSLSKGIGAGRDQDRHDRNSTFQNISQRNQAKDTSHPCFRHGIKQAGYSTFSCVIQAIELQTNSGSMWRHNLFQHL